jgi:hypothetical protein
MPQQQQNIAATISSARAYGALYWSSPAATSNETDTPIKCAGTTAQQGSINKCTVTTSNRITFVGSSVRTFHVVATVGISAATTVTTGKIHIYKGGALITGSTITRYFSNSDTGAIAISAFVDLTTNEYVELWCETNDGDDLTIQNGVMSIISVD